MAAPQANRVAGVLLIVLSVTALVTVMVGFTQPPLPDEGTLAHVFQLTIVALVPTVLVFAATADWTMPARPSRRLGFAAVAVCAAFAALYYLEHYFYPIHHR